MMQIKLFVLSFFLISLSGCKLTVNVSGEGEVNSADGTINCGEICESSYETDQTQTLSAIPAENYQLSKWVGCDSIDAGKCILAVGPEAEDRIVEAHFSLIPEYQLNVNIQGSGSVSSLDGAINCDENCTTAYREDQTLELFATPSENHQFSKWVGCDVIQEDKCVIAVGPSVQDRIIEAHFSPIPEYQILDINFESPMHTVGEPPTYGTEPEYVNKKYSTSPYTNSRTFPIVVDNIEALSGQALLFQPTKFNNNIIGNSLDLSLGQAADQYHISLNIKIQNLVENEYFRIYLDKRKSSNQFRFNHKGEFYFNGHLLGALDYSEFIRLDLAVSLKENTIKIMTNTGFSTTVNLDNNTEDIGSIAFQLYGEPSNSVIIDNLNVKIRYTEKLSIPEPNLDGEYIIDFDYPEIISPYTQYSTGQNPFKQQGFNLNGATRIDPTQNPAYPDGGSYHSSFIYNTTPVLRHQYGYGFSIESMEIARYSDHSTLLRDVEIKALTTDGKNLSLSVPKEMFGDNFVKFEFPDDWKNIKHIELNDSYSVDNIILKDIEEVIYHPIAD